MSGDPAPKLQLNDIKLHLLPENNMCTKSKSIRLWYSFVRWLVLTCHLWATYKGVSVWVWVFFKILYHNLLVLLLSLRSLHRYILFSEPVIQMLDSQHNFSFSLYNSSELIFLMKMQWACMEIVWQIKIENETKKKKQSKIAHYFQWVETKRINDRDMSLYAPMQPDSRLIIICLIFGWLNSS